MKIALSPTQIYPPISLLLFCLGLFLFPYRNIQFVGTPLSNLLFFGSVMSTLAGNFNAFSKRFFTEKIIRWFTLFLAYAFVLNLSWSIYFKSMVAIKYYFFMLFNLLIFANFVELKREYSDKFLDMLKYTSLASLATLAVCALFKYRSIFEHIFLQKRLPDLITRESLFFQNAASLGYFAILALCLFMFSKPSKQQKLIAFALATFLVGISVSRASMLALMALGLCQFMRRTSSFVFLLVGSIGLFLVVGKKLLLGLYYWFPVKISILLRMAQKWSGDDHFNRGFDVLWKGGENHLIWGVSEAFAFNTPAMRFAIEPHASIAYALIDYGIIGTVMLTVFHFKIFKRAQSAYLMGFIAISMYGLFHNGLRHPLYWIILACIYSYGQRQSDRSTEIAN